MQTITQLIANNNNKSNYNSSNNYNNNSYLAGDDLIANS